MKRLLSLMLVTLILAMIISPVSSQAASVSLSAKKVTINKGDSYQLTLKGAKADKVTWTSSNYDMLMVDDYGMCLALKRHDSSEEKVTVTATYKNKEYKCTVTIPAVKVLEPESAIYVGDTFQFGFEGTSLAGVRIVSSCKENSDWVSGKKAAGKIITIDDNGLATAVGLGSVKVNVYNTLGYYETVTITVRKPKTEVELAYDKLAAWMMKNEELQSDGSYTTGFTSGDNIYAIEYFPENEVFRFDYYTYAEKNRENGICFKVRMTDVRKGDDYSINLVYEYIHLSEYGLPLDKGYIAEATIVPQKYKKGSKFNFAITALSGYSEKTATSKLSSIEDKAQTMLKVLNSNVLPKAGVTLKNLGFNNY